MREGIFGMLQRCDKCNAPFSWTEILKSLWWNYRPIHCEKCGAEHKIKFSSRLTFVLLTILPMFFVGYFLAPLHNIMLTFGGAFFVLLTGSFIAPFLVTYREY
ncbi:TIGR04104 family putative zinc finger protein [Oceanobacillus picturae]|uniref:TIGR04104 family putative zinc finger protein n=1 Tax=Oceanobacillus picturae TaxID=171693 RepID=UPI0009E6E493